MLVARRRGSLLADETHGSEVIEIIARFGSGLPADLLPLTMHSTGRVGHDLLVMAIAQGYEQVFVLSNPNKADESPQIMHQIELRACPSRGHRRRR